MIAKKTTTQIVGTNKSGNLPSNFSHELKQSNPGVT